MLLLHEFMVLGKRVEKEIYLGARAHIFAFVYCVYVCCEERKRVLQYLVNDDPKRANASHYITVVKC